LRVAAVAVVVTQAAAVQVVIELQLNRLWHLQQITQSQSALVALVQ